MWMEDMTVPIRDIALHQGIVYLGTPQAIQRRVVSNGNPLTALPAPGASDRIVVHGNFLHHAGLVNGTLRVVKTGLDGTLTWSNDLPLGPEDLLTGCVVDGAGRTWVSVTLRDPIEQLELGGRLFCLGTDGGLLETFAYGTTINGIATDGTYLFATGWSTNTISETYLIGVLTDVVTAVPARDPSPLRIWPQPTNDRVHVVLPSTAQQLQLVDAAGHTVCSWPTNGALRIELGVAGIAAGSYVLHVITADGLRMAEPLLIQR